MDPTSPPPVPFTGRIFVGLVVAEIVEGIRLGIHPAPYLPSTWGLVISALGLNLTYHWWAMSDTYFKVGLSAFYNQTTLPYVAVYIWQLLKNLVPPLPPGY